MFNSNVGSNIAFIKLISEKLPIIDALTLILYCIAVLVIILDFEKVPISAILQKNRTNFKKVGILFHLQILRQII